jgi:methionyl-tRNA formyltransferase
MVIDNLKVKVYKADYLLKDYSDRIGEIVMIDKLGVYIQTLNGVIVLKDIQLQGKKRMLIGDFMNGVGKSLFKVGNLFQ